MHADVVINELLNSATPQMHQSRRTALLWAVSSALNGVALTMTALGRGIGGGAYEKHRFKRADCLMCNLDRGKTRYLLRASEALDGRAFTVHEAVRPREQFMKPAVERQFLSCLALVLAPHKGITHGQYPYLPSPRAFQRAIRFSDRRPVAICFECAHYEPQKQYTVPRTVPELWLGGQVSEICTRAVAAAKFEPNNNHDRSSPRQSNSRFLDALYQPDATAAVAPDAVA